MLLVILFLGITFFILTTFGMAATKLLGVQRKSSFDTIYFVGFCTLLVICGWSSLFVPINALFFYLIAFISLVISFIFRAQLKSNFDHYIVGFKELPLIFKSILLLVLLAFIVSAVKGVTLADSQIYHIQSIKWIENCAVVPGLGNLHGRFAFNSMFFPLSALFTFRDFGGPIYVLNTLSIGVLLVRLCLNVFRGIKAHATFSVVFNLTALILCLLLYPFWISSPSPDIISAILIVFIGVSLLDKPNVPKQILLLIALVVVTIKVSYFVSAGILSVYLAFELRSRFWRTFLLAMVVGLPFLIRNVVLSGYLVYPLNVDLFSFDWEIPVANVIGESDYIKTIARTQSPATPQTISMRMSEWLPIWFDIKSLFNKLLIGLLLFLFYTMLIFYKTGKKKLALFQAVLYANIIFWFFSAPDPRFIHGILILNSALVIAVLIELLKSKLVFDKWLLLLIPVATLIGVHKAGLTNYLSIKSVVVPNTVFPIEVKEEHSSFIYYVPTANNKCSDAPLPCLPEVNSQVIMRGTTIESGFRVAHEKKGDNKY